ncbi:MAG: hypothetical protein ACNS60_00905 [Candidatus Cyclobacteriaceae bacterium M2_1C_046]
MKRWKILSFICLAFVIAACDDDDAPMVDTVDRDDMFNEFDNTTFFEDRDIDGDNNFNETEFNQSFFDAFDLDNDGFIQEDELNTSREDFRASTAVPFGGLDANDDQRLDMDEFRADFQSNDFNATFDRDTDGGISAREFSDGAFERFDDDGDGVVQNLRFRPMFDRHFVR